MIKHILLRMIGACFVACLFGTLFTSCGAGRAAETRTPTVLSIAQPEQEVLEIQLTDSSAVTASMDFIRDSAPRHAKLVLTLQPARGNGSPDDFRAS